MSLFFISVAILVGGYFTYSVLMDRLFKPDPNRPTPAFALTDGVDYVPMSWRKIFLIQLLNLAGLGPIFGALAGALWGPVSFLWIVGGCILAGGVHDYLSGMLSIRNRGASVSEIIGTYLGPAMKNVMRVFSVMLLVLVGTVFVTVPCRSTKLNRGRIPVSLAVKRDCFTGLNGPVRPRGKASRLASGLRRRHRSLRFSPAKSHLNDLSQAASCQSYR